MSDKTAADKTKALDQALSHIEKQYGKGSIMRLGADEKIDVAVIPTGCLSLDLALGIGGVPGAGSSRSTARNPPARPPWPCTSSPRPRRKAGWRPSSTPNTPWT